MKGAAAPGNRAERLRTAGERSRTVARSAAAQWSRGTAVRFVLSRRFAITRLPRVTITRVPSYLPTR